MLLMEQTMAVMPFIYRVSAAKNGARYNQVINDPENHFPVEFSDKSPWVARHTAIFLMESDPDWFEHFKPKDLEIHLVIRPMRRST